jgi:hypothetical protein
MNATTTAAVADSQLEKLKISNMLGALVSGSRGWLADWLADWGVFYFFIFNSTNLTINRIIFKSTQNKKRINSNRASKQE